jgi:hypothetical protein
MTINRDKPKLDKIIDLTHKNLQFHLKTLQIRWQSLERNVETF